MKTHRDMIGARHAELQKRLLRAVSYADRLDEREQDFVQDLATKLETYGERALVTVAQLNWLTRIEGKCEDRRYG
ncbi:MAG: hypothetical protein WAS21_27935 [Geminicoccaceae bacterium]